MRSIGKRAYARDTGRSSGKTCKYFPALLGSQIIKSAVSISWYSGWPRYEKENQVVFALYTS